MSTTAALRRAPLAVVCCATAFAGENYDISSASLVVRFWVLNCARPGAPPVRLYFDAAIHLLLRVSYFETPWDATPCSGM
jgi:hypothetical protein